MDSPSAADPLRGGENSRRAALQAQLEELEKARAEEDAKEQALQQAAHTLQQEGGEMDCQLVGWLVGWLVESQHVVGDFLESMFFQRCLFFRLFLSDI